MLMSTHFNKTTKTKKHLSEIKFLTTCMIITQLREKNENNEHIKLDVWCE